MKGDSHELGTRRIAAAALEIVAALVVATGLVAAMDEVAPVTGLGALYLLAVLFIAIRRGHVAALATAVLSVLALNFFFIEPRYRLTIAESQNVVALAVFLIVAIVVSRLAATARDQTGEAERRALLASAREREAMILAQAASALLAGERVETQLELIGHDSGSSRRALRAGLTSAPAAAPGELAVRIPASRPGWLYGTPDAGWDRDSLERLAGSLARLIDLARERERVAERSADAEAARRADAAKKALLHAISHDLRSPLTAITTAASGLREDALGAEDREGLLEAIEAESERLARMVDDLLDLSRIEAGAVNPRTDWCDLADVLARASESVQTKFGGHPIEVELPPDLPLVRADVAQLERVFSNLLENAVKFSSDPEPVLVSGGSGGGKVTIRVTDKGRGIPPSKRAVIFEPFVQAGDSRQGSGLGLAISRGLVEANGGEISLQASSGGETTFAVAFPLVPQPIEAA